ncbi:hypothetical protein DHD80_18210 [Gramella sp. AN32]|nr:hypothetical protein [Gramella sp. AN32]
MATASRTVSNLNSSFNQWFYSERRKKSSLPMGFWGIEPLWIHAYPDLYHFRGDPVLLLGHSLGTFLYIRNIFILKKDF